MKNLIFSMFLLMFYFSANSQDSLRAEIFKYAKNLEFEKCSRLINNNIDSEYYYKSFSFKEQYIINLLNNKLTYLDFIKNNPYSSIFHPKYSGNIQGYDFQRNDSLSTFLYNYAKHNQEELLSKVDSLASNNALKEYHNLFIEIFLYPKEKEELSIKPIKSFRNYLMSKYKNDYSNCSDTLYYRIKTINLRKVSNIYFIGGTYYFSKNYYTGSRNSNNYLKSLNYSLSIGLIKNRGLLAYEYAIGINSVQYDDYSKNYFSSNDNYSKYIGNNIELRLHLGLGINIINSSRINLSTLVFYNPVILSDEWHYGFKSNLVFNLQRIRVHKNSFGVSHFRRNCIMIGGGFTFNRTSYSFISFSYGINNIKIKKVQKLPSRKFSVEN